MPHRARLPLACLLALAMSPAAEAARTGSTPGTLKPAPALRAVRATRAVRPVRAVRSAPASRVPRALPARTVIGHVWYDSAADAFVVPFDGPAPPVRYQSLSRTHHYFDFRGARLAHDLSLRLDVHASLVRAAVAHGPDGGVRLAFNQKAPARPAIRLELAERRFLVFPGGQARAPLSLVVPGPPRKAPLLPPAPRAVTFTAPAAPAAPPTTRFGGAFYDRKRQALVLPYTGRAPRFSTAHDAPNRLRVEFPASALVAPSAGRPEAALTGWVASAAGGRTAVRVALELAQAGDVVVADDAQERQVLIIPQAFDPAMLEKARGPIRSVLSLPRYDGRLGAVVVPYYGETPVYEAGAVAGGHYAVDFVNAALDPVGVQFGSVTGFPLLAFWLAAKHPDAPLVRVGLSLPYGGWVAVMDDPANQRLLLVPKLGTPPAPAPVPAKP